MIWWCTPINNYCKHFPHHDAYLERTREGLSTSDCVNVLHRTNTMASLVELLHAGLVWLINFRVEFAHFPVSATPRVHFYGHDSTLFERHHCGGIDSTSTHLLHGKMLDLQTSSNYPISSSPLAWSMTLPRLRCHRASTSDSTPYCWVSSPLPMPSCWVSSPLPVPFCFSLYRSERELEGGGLGGFNNNDDNNDGRSGAELVETICNS